MYGLLSNNTLSIGDHCIRKDAIIATSIIPYEPGYKIELHLRNGHPLSVCQCSTKEKAREMINNIWEQINWEQTNDPTSYPRIFPAMRPTGKFILFS